MTWDVVIPHNILTYHAIAVTPGITIGIAINNIHNSEKLIYTAMRMLNQFILILIGGFESFKTSVEEVTTDMV